MKSYDVGYWYQPQQTITNVNIFRKLIVLLKTLNAIASIFFMETLNLLEIEL